MAEIRERPFLGMLDFGRPEKAQPEIGSFFSIPISRNETFSHPVKSQGEGVKISFSGEEKGSTQYKNTTAETNGWGTKRIAKEIALFPVRIAAGVGESIAMAIIFGGLGALKRITNKKEWIAGAALATITLLSGGTMILSAGLLLSPLIVGAIPGVLAGAYYGFKKGFLFKNLLREAA